MPKSKTEQQVLKAKLLKRTSRSSIKEQSSMIVPKKGSVEFEEVMVNSIITDMLNNLTLKGWNNYLKKESINFTISCYWRAFKDIIDLEFLPIDKCESQQDNLWYNDLQAKTSKKDQLFHFSHD